jgi:polysaccharide export outer membrane protein
MNKKTFNLLILVLLVFFFQSCSVNKSFTYFKSLNKDTSISSFLYEDKESKIQKKDIIGINISSLNSEMDATFNSSSKIVSGLNGVVMNSNSNSGFFVDENGEINIHYLGYLKVEGLTLKELKLKLEHDLLPYFKEPIITVQYLNKKITLMGEFNIPRVINLSEDKMTLTDAIVNSGELKENANIKDVLIIRDSGSSKIVKHINLENHSIFLSEWFYLKPNDIVYVRKDTKLIVKQERRQQIQTTFSLLASILSIGVVIINLLIKK